MITLNTVLSAHGIPIETLWLARHQDKRMKAGWSPYKLWRYRESEFLDYQATQQPGKFNRGSHLASFVVDPMGDHIFAGLYKIGAEQNFYRTTDWVAIPEYGENDGAVRYDLQKIEAFSTFEGRMIIDWGAGTLAWAQRAANQDKSIIELRRKDIDVEWPGYENILLEDYALSDLAPNWIANLSAAKGIYLLTCPETGAQYIGSAMGHGGFLARWRAYANGGHGGNVELKKHRTATSAPIQISILEVLGSAVTIEDALESESRWKRKLGTRAHSLNAN